MPWAQSVQIQFVGRPAQGCTAGSVCLGESVVFWVRIRPHSSPCISAALSNVYVNSSWDCSQNFVIYMRTVCVMIRFINCSEHLMALTVFCLVGFFLGNGSQSLNSVSLSDLRMSDSIFWGHCFSILLHYLSVMFCFSACLTVGRRAEVWKPQSFQKEISCNQTILLLRKCETQSKLLLPHSYLEQVYFDIRIAFYFF